MTLPPLVERELRTGARRTSLFWLRGLLALVLGGQAYDLLSGAVIGPTGGAAGIATAAGMLTGSTLLQHMSLLLFVAVLLMGLLSADSISRERREGTLGLLLLTDLTPFQIVYGKMISCGLNSFLILLGGLPVLMVPVLIGGVTGTEAVITGLGLLNALFVSLATGLWMSAFFRERRCAIGMTLAVVAALAFGSELLGASAGAARAPLFRLLGLGGWMTLAQLRWVYALLFIPWFVVINGVGWLILYWAGLTLSRNWQDQPHQQVREARSLQEEWPTLVLENEAAEATAGRASWLTDPRPWDANPVRWRVERIGPIDGLIWFAVALDFIGQFCALGTGSGGRLSGDWGLVSFSGLVAVLFSGGLLAWAGARFFVDTKRQQDLELILTTTVGSRGVLSGQWQVLRKALKFPLTVVLLVALPSGISMMSSSGSGALREFWSSFPTFMIPVNLAAEIIALGWMGMYCGLQAQHPATAVLRTVAWVQLIPLTLAGALGWLAWKYTDDPATLNASHGHMPVIAPILLFLLAKNLALIFWARFRLRSLLRLARRGARRNNSVNRLVPQPA